MWLAHGFPCPGGEATLYHPGAGSKPRRCRWRWRLPSRQPTGEAYQTVPRTPRWRGWKKTLNNVRSRVRRADEQGSPFTDTDMWSICWQNLNIIPGECADEAVIGTAQVWATAED